MLNRWSCPFIFAAALLASSFHVSSARDISELDILNDAYPRAFFFRAAEGACSERRYPTYESWEQQFNRLQGIIGKCLNEECIGREPRNPEFFSRFKQDHPHQAVLLHFNGNARDPRYHTEKYFPGHWVYRKATMITEDVPAETGETVIHVEDARDFRVNAGRYHTSNDDIALFRITEDGKHDWDLCEQVQLVSVDQQANTITVRRGCYETRPLAFPAGTSRAAAHAVEGPWGASNNIMWFYNFSTHCPRDDEGKTCADRLVDDLAQWFGPEGKLAAFDGLEFDVMHNQTHGDTDGDGVEDHGVIGGVNQYGIGMVEFARQLRQRMTDNFVIQGDGALGTGGSRSQRAWGLLNGIESEGWPNLKEWEMGDWSGGMNRHFFWRDNAREPVFNYVNHKWIESVPGQPGVTKHPQVAFARHRLVFAVCQFFDAATCYSLAPKNDPDRKFGVWDELRRGVDNKIGWLGRPEAAPIRMASRTEDLLGGQGRGESLAKRITGDVEVVGDENGVCVVPRDPTATQVRFSIRGIPTAGPELTALIKMSGPAEDGYPREMARFANVTASGGMVNLMANQPIETGMKLRGKTEEPIDSATGATFQDRPREIAGATLPTRFTHPPYRDGTGYTYWIQEALVPRGYELRFSLGMGQLSPERSDGVRFEVHAAEVDDRQVGPYRKLFEQVSNEYKWLPQRVPLSQYAGKRVRFKFVADCGEKDNATTDHAHWGDVKLVKAGASESQITKAVKYMTWVNDRPFESSFYFREIKSNEIELSVVVEGSEPVSLQSVTAYAHPDAMCRVFEHGIVLANPSHAPYTFQLAELTPGRKYRRIQGVATQDPETNSGEAVGDTVTLGERDALFLVRVE